MSSTERALVRFLAEYEVRLNRALCEPPDVDIEGTASAFWECFFAAGPWGVECKKNDDEFRATIPKGLEFYRRIGTTGMKIAALTVTDLDEIHSMAKVRWHSIYKKPDASQIHIDFDVIYLFRMGEQGPLIFGYITGDEEAALREHGLIAA